MPSDPLTPKQIDDIGKAVAKPFGETAESKDYAKALLDEAMAIRNRVYQDMKLEAAEGKLLLDPKGFELRCGTKYVDAFHHWDKERLLYLLCYLHTKMTMERLR